MLSYCVTHKLPEANVPWTNECGVVRRNGFEIRLYMVKLRNSKETVYFHVAETALKSRLIVSTTWVCEDTLECLM